MRNGGIKFKYKLILFLVLTLSLSLNGGCVTAQNLTSTENSSYIIGYYINPGATPLSEIDFKALKSAGITDIYVLVTNKNYLSVLSQAKEKADAVGIKTHAWVYPGFKYAAKVAQMKMGVHLDVETYNMPSYLLEILDMRLATMGETFSLTVKPDGWDGNQYYFLIAPLCDYIVPQLYIGEYNNGITGLKEKVQSYNFYYPGKIVAGLETYQSDKNPTPKNASAISQEITAVKPYTGGVILFRYGLSNFNGL